MSDFDDKPNNRRSRRAAKQSGGAAPAAAGSDSEGEGSASGSDTGSGSGSGSAPAAAASPKPVKQRRKKDDPLAEFTATKAFGSTFIGLFIFAALVLSAAPAYLYHSVYDLSVSEFVTGYVFCVVVSTGLLTWAYQLIANSTHAALSNQRKANASNNKLQKDLKYSREELDQISETVTTNESLYHALVFNNIVYVVLWLFLAFYMLRDIYVPWNYAISQLLTAGATYWVAQTMSK